MLVDAEWTELTDEEIEAVDDRMDGHCCPECGANDWLAEERTGDYIRVRCDDCCRYGVLISHAGGATMSLFEAVDEPRERPHPCEAPGCDTTVPYDDEPCCFEHSAESGSYVSGYSYRRSHADEN